jgi:hypothetical protein
VAAHDFAFVLTLPGHPHDTEMLNELLRTVLAHAGYAGDTLDRLVKQVTRVHAAAAQAEPCAVRFEAHGGELQIVVSHAGRDWRTTCPVLTH